MGTRNLDKPVDHLRQLQVHCFVGNFRQSGLSMEDAITILSLLPGGREVVMARALRMAGEVMRKQS